jgi:ubiquitin-conjugating enzyme E2 variant
MTVLLLCPPTAAAGASAAAAPAVHVFWVALALGIMFTNQTHKASHQVSQPAVVKTLMNAGVLLSPKKHRVHHTGDHGLGYCITTGWCNPFLDAINFWRAVEFVISSATGAIPREDDLALLAQ